MRRLARKIRNFLRRAAAGSALSNEVLGTYVAGAPVRQNLVDIFAGSWSSALPADEGALRAGSAVLFDDTRITWAVDALGGVAGKRVLELGPLEGGHSYMMQKLGAASVLAIEANRLAFLKCLLVKELYHLDRCRFELGDFVEYLRQSQESGERFDLCVACGVLYHMTDPVELLGLIAKASDRAILWTHYYAEAPIRNNPNTAKKFNASEAREVGGFKHTLYKQHYGEALGWSGFCGGAKPYSYWLSYDDLLAGLRHVGFKRIEVSFHTPDHQNGPAVCLACEK
jgi:Protein of unknown function (DUF1698)